MSSLEKRLKASRYLAENKDEVWKIKDLKLTPVSSDELLLLDSSANGCITDILLKYYTSQDCEEIKFNKFNHLFEILYGQTKALYELAKEGKLFSTREMIDNEFFMDTICKNEYLKFIKKFGYLDPFEDYISAITQYQNEIKCEMYKNPLEINNPKFLKLKNRFLRSNGFRKNVKRKQNPISDIDINLLIKATEIAQIEPFVGIITKDRDFIHQGLIPKPPLSNKQKRRTNGSIRESTYKAPTIYFPNKEIKGIPIAYHRYNQIPIIEKIN